MQLNVFEPRYRLLVRRCMEGNRRFGMATVNQLGQLSDIACQGEILECMPLPDGYDLLCCCISLFNYKHSRYMHDCDGPELGLSLGLITH